MLTVHLTKGDVVNLSSLLAGSIVVHNLGNLPVYIYKGAVAPSVSSYGVRCSPMESVSVNVSGSEQLYAVAENTSILLLEEMLSSSGQHVCATLPESLFTQGDEGYRRLRVDDGQTSFFLGTQARTFKELNIAAGTSYYVKIVVPVDVVLFDVNTVLDNGTIRITTLANPVFSGTWSETLPVIPKNTMASRPSPYYVPQVSLTAGGTATGVAIDIVRLSVSNSSAKAQSVGSQPYSERGVAAGTYCWQIENIGTGSATGTFSSWWEERP